MRYEKTIDEIVAAYAKKLAKCHGKTREAETRKLLTEMAEAVRKVVREQTIEFYRQHSMSVSDPSLSDLPLFQRPVPPS